MSDIEAGDEQLHDRARLVVLSSSFNQREFADRIGMDPTALSKALRGTRQLRDNELTALAKLGGVSLRYLRTGAGRAPRAQGKAASALRERADSADPDVRRAQILDAAADLIARTGFHNVRVSDIARACGTSTGTIHHYFPTKDAALDAALNHYAERLFARLDTEFAQAGDTLNKLRRLIDAQLISSEQDADEWSIWIQSWTEAILQPDRRAFQHRVYSRWRAIVIGLITAAQAEGFGVSADAEALTSRFTGMVDGLAIQLLAGTADMSTATMRELLLDAFEPHIRLR